jgi:hypothetical protein
MTVQVGHLILAGCNIWSCVISRAEKNHIYKNVAINSFFDINDQLS